MADNFNFTPGTGATGAADDVSGVLYPRVKIDLGGDGAASPLTEGQKTKANSLPVTIASDDAIVLAAGTNNIGDVDVLSVPSDPFGANADASSATGSISAKLRAAATALEIIDDWDESDRAKVNLIVGQAGVAAGAGAVGPTVQRVTLASDDPAVTALQLLDNIIAGNEAQVDVLTLPGVAGDVAHDAVDSGNPVKVGARAVAHGTNPTAVAAADRVDAIANRAGVRFVIGGHPNTKCATYNTSSARTDDNVLAAISAGTKYVVTGYSITLDEATTVGVALRLGFGASTIPALGADGADAVEGILFSHPGMVPGGGVARGDGSGILGIGGDGEELRVTCEVPTSGRLDISVTYYTIES